MRSNYSDLFEVIRLAIGAKTEAAAFYIQQLAVAFNAQDRSMLKILLRFEKSHKQKL